MELKVLMGLKRNSSSKSWTVREDLMILTLTMSNREIAEQLQERNKEAVKKRLQLLRSKGLCKRMPEPPVNPAPVPEAPPTGSLLTDAVTGSSPPVE